MENLARILKAKKRALAGVRESIELLKAAGSSAALPNQGPEKFDPFEAQLLGLVRGMIECISGCVNTLEETLGKIDKQVSPTNDPIG